MLIRRFLNAQPTVELEPRTEKYHQSDEADMGMTYKELSLFGLLRKTYRCGPISMYRSLVRHWGMNLSPKEVYILY
jgi:NAD+ synthase (glutamine-hydrolysing)